MYIGNTFIRDFDAVNTRRHHFKRRFFDRPGRTTVGDLTLCLDCSGDDLEPEYQSLRNKSGNLSFGNSFTLV